MSLKRLVLALAISAPLAGGGLTACGNDYNGPTPPSFAADTLNADFRSLGMLFSDSTINGADTLVQYGLDQHYGTQIVGANYNQASGSRFVQSFRGVLRYDLSVLAAHAVIDSARLSVWQCAALGYATNSGNFNPYTAGHVQLDHVQYPVVVASNAETFIADTLGASLGAVIADSSLGLRNISVTAAVAADYASRRTTSEFRLDWIFDSPPVSDTNVYYYVGLGSTCGSSSSSGPSPFLIVWSH